MTVYVHTSALVLAASDAGPGRPATARPLNPGAAEALGRLAAAGFDIAIVGEQAAPLPDELASIHRAAELPDPLETGSWFLTGEPNPASRLPRGGTTVLVGPRPPDGRIPLPRFDMTARDIASAAMEVLLRDAMA